MKMFPKWMGESEEIHHIYIIETGKLLLATNWSKPENHRVLWNRIKEVKSNLIPRVWNFAKSTVINLLT